MSEHAQSEVCYICLRRWVWRKRFTARFIVSRCVFCKLRRNFGFFCSINHLRKPLIGNRCLLERVQKVMVCDLWLVDFDPFSLFLCFKVPCLWSSWFGQKSTHVVQRFFWSFFDTNVYPTCIVKQCLAPSFDKKFHSPSQFPLLFLSSLQSFAVLFLLAKQGKRIALWLALTPSPLKRFQRKNRETQNPLICNLQNAWRDTMNFGCKWRILRTAFWGNSMMG